MGIARWHSVELIEDALQIIPVDTNAIVFYLYVEVGRIAPCGNYQLQADIIALILDSIVHQIIDDIGEMHLVCLYGRVDRIQIGLNSTTVLHHLDIECLDNAIYQSLASRGCIFKAILPPSYNDICKTFST